MQEPPLCEWASQTRHPLSNHPLHPCVYLSAQKASSYKKKLIVNAIDLIDDNKELFEANLSELVEIGSTDKHKALQYEAGENDVQEADTSEANSLLSATPEAEKSSEQPAEGPNFGTVAPVPPSNGGLGNAEPPHPAEDACAKGARKRSASDGKPKRVLALWLRPTCRLTPHLVPSHHAPAPFCSLVASRPTLCSQKALCKKKVNENTAPQLSEYEKERDQSCANDAQTPHHPPPPHATLCPVKL